VNAAVEAIVYQATNTVNGKRYIGFTTQQLAARQREHLKNTRYPKKRFMFQNAILKHGMESFVFETLAEFEDADLARVYEIEAIAKYRPEYNLKHGGEGSSMPEITRQRISASNKGRVGPMKGKKFTDEHKAKISAANKGREHLSQRGVPFTEERRRKISAKAMDRVSPGKGVKRSADATQRTLETKRLRKLAGQTYVVGGRLKGAPLRKPVVCLTDGKKFDSIRAAAIFYDLNLASLRDVLNGRREAVRGLVFAFEVAK